eukprot:m.865632 g.865632  ORF g.865632 m.865632 type:complete len:317 (-) comp23551_c0_seq14:3318-4268(-)
MLRERQTSKVNDELDAKCNDDETFTISSVMDHNLLPCSNDEEATPNVQPIPEEKLSKTVRRDKLHVTLSSILFVVLAIFFGFRYKYGSDCQNDHILKERFGDAVISEINPLICAWVTPTPAPAQIRNESSLLIVSSDSRVATHYRDLSAAPDNRWLHVLENSGQYANWRDGNRFDIANGAIRFVPTDASRVLQQYSRIVFAERLTVIGFSGRSPLSNLAYSVIRKAPGFHWRNVIVLLRGGSCALFHSILDGGSMSIEDLPDVDACTQSDSARAAVFAILSDRLRANGGLPKTVQFVDVDAHVDEVETLTALMREG